MATLELRAPLDGIILPLEQVPDPVFCQKMVGDGLAIDPLSQVLTARCPGAVTQIHHAGQAVTLTTAEGIEILMHIGLDTVALKGRGFEPRVTLGQKVVLGDALITFGADLLATNAKSLLTLLIVTTGERVASMVAASGRVSAGRG